MEGLKKVTLVIVYNGLNKSLLLEDSFRRKPVGGRRTDVP